MSNWMLFLSLAAGAVLLAAAIGVIVKKHCRDTGLLCVRETWVTALLGAMLIALGFAFPVMKLMDNTLAGTGSQSQWIVAAFSLLCHLMGDFTLLFTFVKCTVLFDDRMVAYSPFGNQATISWENIVEVKRPVTGSAFILTDSSGTTIRVGGDSKASREFAQFAQSKVKSVSGAALLHQVERRLGGGR